MAETLTGSQRLRAFITGKVVRISDLEKILETRDTRITTLEAESKKWSTEAQRTETLRVDAERRNTNLQTDIAAANKRVKELEEKVVTEEGLAELYRLEVEGLKAELAGFQGIADEYAPAQLEAPAKG